MSSRTIVTVDELERRLGDPSWVIADCRHSLADFSLGRQQYDESHIPGAFFVSVEDELAGTKTGRNGRHPLPEPQAFAAVLREFGVKPDTQIVAYDAGADMFAARMWFLAKYIGHSAVAILDGGFAAWRAAGKPVTTQIPKRPANGTILAEVRSDLTVDVHAVLQSLRERHLTLLDARAADRFAGQNETVDPVAGHIPGARHRHFKDNFDERGLFKNPQQLRAEFERLQIDPDRMVHQCGSGVSSAVNLLAMEIAGIGGSRIYPGSWSEWIADPSRPIATGS